MENSTFKTTRRAALAAALIPPFLAACGGGGASTETPEPPPAPPPPPLPPPAPTPPPTITRNPANVSVVAGGTASFDVATAGSPVTAYQWLRDETEIASATAATYSFGPVSLLDSGKTFAVRAANSGGTVTSQAATLTATSLPVTLVAGSRSEVGDVDGPASLARFNGLSGNGMPPIAADDAGNVYIGSYSAISARTLIRKVAIDGTVTTLAGIRGASNTMDGTGASARFTSIFGLSYDRVRKVLVVVQFSPLRGELLQIRQVTLDGVVTTGPSFWSTAQLRDPAFSLSSLLLAGAPDGTLYFASGNIRDPGGFATTAFQTAVFKKAPGAPVVLLAGNPDQQGSMDGDSANARFYRIRSLAADASGNVFAAETGRVRKIAPDGMVTTLVGSSAADPSPGAPAPAIADGQGSAAVVSNALAMAVEASGSVLVLDGYLRRITAAGNVVTLADLGLANNGSGPLALDAAGKAYFTASGWVGRVDWLGSP